MAELEPGGFSADKLASAAMAADDSLPNNGPRPDRLKSHPSAAQFNAADLESMVMGDAAQRAKKPVEMAPGDFSADKLVQMSMAADDSLPDNGPRPEHLKSHPSAAQFNAAALEAAVMGGSSSIAGLMDVLSAARVQSKQKEAEKVCAELHAKSVKELRGFEKTFVKKLDLPPVKAERLLQELCAKTGTEFKGAAANVKKK